MAKVDVQIGQRQNHLQLEMLMVREQNREMDLTEQPR